jgi:hypothetical protein
VSTKKFAAVGGIIRPLGGILEVPKTPGFFKVQPRLNYSNNGIKDYLIIENHILYTQ